MHEAFPLKIPATSKKKGNLYKIIPNMVVQHHVYVYTTVNVPYILMKDLSNIVLTVHK